MLPLFTFVKKWWLKSYILLLFFKVICHSFYFSRKYVFNWSSYIFGLTVVWMRKVSFRNTFFLNFFFHLFLLVGGKLLYNIVVVFAIHLHELAMELHVFPIPIPPRASLPIPSFWVFPVHQPWALVSCIQPGLVICFTVDSILVSMLFSQNIPPSSSPRVPKSVLYICVSFSVLHIGLLLLSF